MRVLHLNCGTLNPRYPPIPSICYCLLLEMDEGLALIDTGFGVQDYLKPSPAVRFFTWANRMPCELQETALHQIIKMGYQPGDVRHIVMTHLHIDHAGGLRDFPNALVHVHQREYEAALFPRGLLARLEYVQEHWSHQPQWALHFDIDRQWFGFDAIHLLGDDSFEVLLIPLTGHTPGHCGVAVKDAHQWYLFSGDETYPFYNPKWIEAYGRPPAWLIRLAGVGTHMEKLQTLWREHKDQVRIIFAHDLVTFNELK